ncbi:MAG: FxSxx-COOH system tetratricopeptide repeat protein [Sciscionella sp.]
MTAEDLTWTEVADAVWLASVTQPAWDTNASSERDPAGGDQAAWNEKPAGAGVPAESRSADSDVAAHQPDLGVSVSRTPDTDLADVPESVERTDEREPPPESTLVSLVDSGVVGPTRQLVQAPVPPLPDALAIVRALRPLHRKVLSRREDDVVLDEDATAERAVQDGLWLPETTPATERWLDLTLVVDANPSMALWRSTTAAFESLLERLGTFRRIQRRLLDTHRSGQDPRVIPVLRGGTPETPARDPAELLDPTGRRVILVLTDGVSESWRDESFTTVLARWGTSMPTAMVHLLPQRLWRRSGLSPHRARLASRGRLKSNRRWSLHLPDAWLEPDPAAIAPDGTVPVPVFELEARWLARWAQLLVGNDDGPVDATVLLANESPTFTDDRSKGESVSDLSPAREQVGNFVGAASPPAFRLATLLAAVPVSLPVARLIQAELVPEAGIEHIVEALSSGLFEPEEPDATRRRPWDTVTFNIHQGVREELLSCARRSETARVVRMVTSHFGDQIGTIGRVQKALDAPDSTPDPDVSSATVHDIAIERIVMRALSGPYLSRAGRLSQEQATSVDTTKINPTTLVSNDMSNTAERTGLTTEQNRLTRPVPETSTVHAAPSSETDVGNVAAPGRSGPPTSLAPALGIERQADDAPPIWGNVPPRNPNFTGRIELLDDLSERLAAGGTTAVLPSALHGMGGIGKTQTVVEYIYRHLHDYDVVWWIRASHATQIRADLTELAQALRLPGSAEANTAVPAVREALRRGQPFRRWLLMFDAAEGPETVRPFFPTNGPGEILITSRNPDWASVARPLEIATFNRSESIELLRRRGPVIDDRDADRLADVLGDLPLAIEQAAAWRAETGMPVGEYLRLFDEKVAEILNTSAPADYEVSVAAAWNVSFDELSKRSMAAHQLLQVCAFFSPEPISRQLFTGIRGISIASELDAALRDPMKLSRAIRDINRYGLAKIDHRSDTLQLHRLVQLVLRNRMTPQHHAEMRHGAHLLLANLDPNDPLSPKQWQRYQDVLPHAYAANLIECDDSWGRQLVINLMSFLYRWGDHEEAVSLAERALQQWTRELGEKDPQTLQVAARLGYYYWVVGRYTEAADLNRRTLDIRRQVDGENNEETLSAQLTVVADLKAQGNFAASFELSAEVYQKAKGLFGDDDPTTLRAARIHSIGLRLTGEYQKARDLDSDTYRRQVDVLGYDHPDTLSTLSGLIMDRREAGEYLWARDEQEKLAVRARELHGENNADTLRRLAYLAVARRKAGDHRGALELSSQVLERFRIRYGPDSFNAMACALGHSIDLRHDGDLRSARKLGEEVFNRYRGNLGEHHPYTFCATVDLAVTLRLLGDAAAARHLDERSLEQLRATLGPDHAHAIVCAIDLASDLAALGDAEAALAVDTEALERSERVLGIDHPTSLAASLNLVLDLRVLGREQDAEKRYADVLTRYRMALGEEHPATIAAVKGVRADCDIDPLPL